MKEGIEKLLQKYQSGNLSDEELRQLITATDRDEVMTSAVEQAGRLRKQTLRRGGGLLSVVAVVVAVLLLQWNKPQEAVQQQHLWVESDNTELHEEEVVAPMQKQPTFVAQQKSVAATKPQVKQNTKQRVVVPQNTVQHAVEAEPQVMCNVQCDADSVISDIWKFLKA